MNTKKFLMACLLLVSAGVFAQHDNNWYFGRWAGLTFDSGSPVALDDGILWSVEASAAISDADGGLLLYTEGVNIYNKNHVAMPNGSGLLGDRSSAQGAIIIPKPGSASRFYVFTADDGGGPDGLAYSEVDMTLDGGLGDAVSLNNPLAAPVCEKIAAVYHANGTDIWVVVHHFGSDAYYSYLVTPDGVSATPVTSNAGIIVEGANNSGRYSGGLAISPDGTKLAAAHHNLSAQLFDFDTSTGIVSNPVTFHAGEHYGIAFSPDSSLLYLTTAEGLLQYQADAPDVPASMFVVAPPTVRCALRLGPDGKIHVVHEHLQDTMSKIDQPNVAGAGCNYMPSSTSLAEGKTFAGLPAFITSPLYVLDINYALNCQDASLSFSFTATIAPDTIEWDFGDGTTSTDMNPVHTYAAPGTYTVKVKATKGIFAAYYSEEITVAPVQVPVANAPGHLRLCDEGNDGVEEFTLTVQDAVVLGGQNTADFTVTYHNSLTDAEEGINALPDVYANASNLETIYARVTANATGCHAVTAFLLKLSETPVIDMEDSFILCQGGTLELAAPEGFDSYLWSTGETTRTITVDEAGTYTLTVAADDEGLLCESSKDVLVEAYEIPIPELDEEYISCRGFGVSIEAPHGYDSYAWSTGDVGRTIHLEKGGTYTLTVTKNGCEATEEFRIKEILCGFDVPRGISPNGDGKNDALDLTGMNVTRIDIFNRYGLKVYSKRDYTDEWHGQDERGYELPDGTYFFSASAVNRADETGWIYISREY